MSYDLYIMPEDKFGPRDFVAYFKGRPHYRSSDDGSEVHYWNEDTGVYFTFSYSAPLTQEEIRAEIAEDPDLASDHQRLAQMRRPTVHFDLNYVRPHVFGIEAEPELAALVKAFNCAIMDDQIDGMADGPYSRDGFLRGWNAGNRFGYQVLLPEGDSSVSHDAIAQALRDHGVVLAPSEDVADVWAWNIRRERLQDTVTAKGRDVFVPKIMWGRDARSGDVVRFVAWSLGVATVLPGEANHVLVGREKRARSLLGRFGIKRYRPGAAHSYLLLRRDDLLDVLPKIAHVHAMGRDLVYCPAGPDKFDENFWHGFSRVNRSDDPSSLVQLLAPDSVLDADIFDSLQVRV